MRTVLLVTCEHGGNRIPGPYQKFFKEVRQVLQTHRRLQGLLVKTLEALLSPPPDHLP